MAPKTSIKLIENRPKAKSNSFYLHENGREKAQTIHLTSSCKPPPVIPSGLKIGQNDTLGGSVDWLKRNGLKGLKLNIERWERRATTGSAATIFVIDYNFEYIIYCIYK